MKLTGGMGVKCVHNIEEYLAKELEEEISNSSAFIVSKN